MKEIMEKLKACKNFYEFLCLIRDTDDLELVDDNGWSWLTYKGEEIEGTGKERFTNSTEMNALFKMAGL